MPSKPMPTPMPAEKKTAAAKSPVKPAQKQVTPAEVKPAKPTRTAKAEKPVKAEKPKKPKLIRDSFTIPKAEYELLDVLKTRAIRLKQPAKKSELLRAGVKLLVGLTDAAFLAAMQAVPALKTGRPVAEPVAKKATKA